jgi:hypothetical protein
MSTVDLNSIMQPEEAAAIGVESLSEAQRQALAAWGLRMFGLGEVVSGTIDQLRYGGRLIVLDDGSRWEAEEGDDVIAELWEPGGRVVVIDDEMFFLEDAERITVHQEF